MPTSGSGPLPARRCSIPNATDADCAGDKLHDRYYESILKKRPDADTDRVDPNCSKSCVCVCVCVFVCVCLCVCVCVSVCV